MQNYINKLVNNINSNESTIKIGFPDGTDTRILEAIKKLERFNNVKSIIIDEAYIENYADKQKILDIFKKKRQDKNTLEDFEKWLKIPNYFAMGLLELNEIDCIVGGATTATSDLLRPALQIIKAKEKIITSFMWMKKNEENYFFGDCAIIPTPEKNDLYSMSSLIAKGVKNIFDINPYIAMLSFSTNGSGGNKNESVNNVREISERLKNEGYKILGETQFDAAFDYQTRKQKWKEDLKEQPNVYIFPDLNSANIGYKIMKLTGGYEAIGPIIVGLNKPVNDLSRGCNSEEIFILALITINIYLASKKEK